MKSRFPATNSERLDRRIAQYTDPTVDQAGWEAAAATSVGLREVYVAYANEAGISPGAELFVGDVY